LNQSEITCTGSVMMKYLSVQEMVEIEKAADSAGHSYAEMMEAAGKGLAGVIVERIGSPQQKPILALVGSGNNGGDALVALDYLAQWGWKTAAALFRPREPQDLLISRFLAGGGALIDCCGGEKDFPLLLKWLKETSIILDGVLGTGIRLPIREPLETLLRLTKDYLATTEEKPFVVAVDCPSGVDCDSGEVSSACIAADLTVTMAAVKQGLLKFPGYDYVGELKIVEIGLPPDLLELSRISREVIDGKWVKQVLPDRPKDAHKGTFGTSLIIAGSRSYPGAAGLAGVSAYRIGAGLVAMAIPESIYSGLVENFPEAIWVVLDENEGGIAPSGLLQIKENLKRPTACLIGPGLGLADGTAGFLDGFFELKKLPPLIIDADGLQLLSRLDQWQSKLPGGSVLTPHPGEMSALSGLSVEQIQSDRVGVAEKVAQDLNQIILLKGAHTVIADPGGETRVLIGANPALAKAGSGDVLAGIICGLIAQGLSSFDAAVAGVWIHFQAGEQAAKRASSPTSVLAGEISASIGSVLADI
jgi:NAD(P)H-hydrate epimerase